MENKSLIQAIPDLPFEVKTIGVPNLRLVMDWVKQEEADELIEFLLAHFLTAPPLRQIYLFDESPKTRRPAWYMNLVRQYVSQPYSLIVRDQSFSGGNQIVAASVNHLELEKRRLDNHQVAVVSKELLIDQSVGWLRRALGAELNRDVDLFNRFQTDKILKLGTGSIRADLGKLGLITLMCKLAIDKAYNDGAGAVKTEAFSNSGIRWNLKNGFKIMRTVDYGSFEYPPGVKPLRHFTKMLKDHRCAHLVAKRLPVKT